MATSPAVWAHALVECVHLMVGSGQRLPGQLLRGAIPGQGGELVAGLNAHGGEPVLDGLGRMPRGGGEGETAQFQVLEPHGLGHQLF
jgi:hypothetical protein